MRIFKNPLQTAHPEMDQEPGQTSAQATPKKSFGRNVPGSVAAKSVRTFLPVLAMVAAAGCSGYTQHNNEKYLTTSGPNLSADLSYKTDKNFISGSITPEEFKTPNPTQDKFYTTDKFKIKEHIKNLFAENSMGTPNSHPNVFYSLIKKRGTLLHKIMDEKTYPATAYWFHASEEEQNKLGFEKACIITTASALNDPHDLSKLLGLDGLRLRQPESADTFREFINHHEESHCQTFASMPHKVPEWANEFVADIYASAKYVQETGDMNFPEQWKEIRTINSYLHFDIHHYTVPALERALPRIEDMHNQGILEQMSDAQIQSFATDTVFNKEIDRETGEPVYEPKPELEEDIAQRASIAMKTIKNVRFSRDGILEYRDDDLDAELKEGIDDYTSAVSKIYVTEDTELSIKERQRLMADYYNGVVDDFIQTHDDPEIVLEALQYKTWEAKKEARENSYDQNEVLLPQTRLDILQHHKEKFIEKHNIQPAKEPSQKEQSVTPEQDMS